MVCENIPGMNMGGMGGGNSNFSGGVNPQMLQQLGIEGPITNQVFVANVSVDFKNGIFFRMFGAIVRFQTSPLGHHF